MLKDTAYTRPSGRVIGFLMLVHMATGLIVPYVLLQPVQADFLGAAAGMDVRVRLCVLLLFIGGVIPVAISAAVWPLVRESRPQLGLWLIALCAANLALQAMENSYWLSMLTVSQDYAQSASDSSLARSLATVVRAGWKWTHYSHLLIVVGWLFTLFLLMLRAGLVPRALAAVGLVTCLLQFTGITLPELGGYSMPMPTLFGMPLGFAILAVSAWLMLRGFSRSQGPPGARADDSVSAAGEVPGRRP